MKRLAALLWLLMLANLLLPLNVYAEQTPDKKNDDRANTLESGTDNKQLTVINNRNSGVLPIFYEERVFRGEAAQQDSYFEISRGLKAEQNTYLDIYFSHAETVLPDRSSMIVLLDDIPLVSIPLDQSNAKETRMRIDLPAAKLVSGFHKISFVTKMKVNEAVCEDPQNSSSWLVLHQKSKLNMKLAPKYNEPNLSYYPSPFAEKGAPKPINALLVVPENITDAEFKAAAQLSQFIAKQTVNNMTSIPIYRESELTESILQKQSIVWVGEANRWLNWGKTSLDAYKNEIADKWSGKAFIGIGKSPWNNDNSVLFISGDDPHLLNGATILTTNNLYNQLQGTHSIIPDSITEHDKPEELSPGKEYLYSLEQLGFSNLTTENVVQGGSTISYQLPLQWDLADNASFHLTFNHSKAIAFDKSVLTVKLNGTPVQSVKLNAETAENGAIDVPLKPSVIGASRNLNIEISFQFVQEAGDSQKSGWTGDCAEHLLGNWGVVSKTSYFTFEPVQRMRFNLDSVPYPFYYDQKWHNTTFLLGTKQSAELKTAMNLIVRMGAPVKSSSDIKLLDVSSGNLMESIKDRNLIFVGTTEHLPDFLNGFEQSYVTATNKAIASKSDEVNFLTELTHDSAIMQLTVSPLNQDKYFLMLASTDKEHLLSMGAILTDPSKNAAINGRLVAIDSLSNIHTFENTIDVSEPEAPQPIVNESTEQKLPYGKYIFIAALVVVLILLFVLIVMIRRKNKDRT